MIDWFMEVFLSESDFPPTALYNNDTAENRAYLSIINPSIIRPTSWSDSEDRVLWGSCDFTDIRIDVPERDEPHIPPHTTVPCIVDFNRIQPSYGPYFIHVWGWKRIGNNWVPITESDEVRVRPYVEVLDLAGYNMINKTPLTQDEQPFHRGLNAMALDSNHINKIKLALGQTITNQFYLSFGVDKVFIPSSEWKQPLVTPYSEHFVQTLTGGNEPWYKEALCVVPKDSFCDCAERIRYTPIPGLANPLSPFCGRICKCVDPSVYNLYYAGYEVCSDIPFGVCVE